MDYWGKSSVLLPGDLVPPRPPAGNGSVAAGSRRRRLLFRIGSRLQDQPCVDQGLPLDRCFISASAVITGPEDRPAFTFITSPRAGVCTLSCDLWPLRWLADFCPRFDAPFDLPPPASLPFAATPERPAEPPPLPLLRCEWPWPSPASRS